MSEKLSKRILVGELIVIILPSSLILAVATLLKVSDMFEYFSLGDAVILLTAFIAWISLISGFVISKTFIKQGTSELRKLKSHWWVLVFLGIIIHIMAWTSVLLPPSPEYPSMAMFRFEFNAFVLSSPLLIPLIHLPFERYLRKEIEPS